MMISMLYHVPIIGAIFKKLINQKTTNAKASYTKKDIIKVIFRKDSNFFSFHFCNIIIKLLNNYN